MDATPTADSAHFALPEGIIVPLVTPLDERGRLDVEGLERVVTHVTAGGVHGLFLLGTTGEGPSLVMDLKRQLVRRVLAMTGPALPVYVCLTDPALDHALALAEHAATHGAAAVVAAPPFYFPLHDEELLHYYERLCTRLPLPLMLYNMPATTRQPLSPQLVSRLVQITGVIGLKDSGGQWEPFERIRTDLAHRHDLAILVGSENLLLRALMAGVHGGVCGSANIAPAAFRHLYDHTLRHPGEPSPIHQRQLTFFARLYTIGRHWGRHVANIKFALASLGLCEPYLAPPLTLPSPPEQTAIRNWVAHLDHLDHLDASAPLARQATP